MGYGHAWAVAIFKHMGVQEQVGSHQDGAAATFEIVGLKYTWQQKT
jgi:hypothetical protein